MAQSFYTERLAAWVVTRQPGRWRGVGKRLEDLGFYMLWPNVRVGRRELRGHEGVGRWLLGSVVCMLWPDAWVG